VFTGDRGCVPPVAGRGRRLPPAGLGRQAHAHVLRHFCASQLYLAGMGLFAIQELLGHAWTGTTARYTNPRELHQAGEKLQVAC
jgi:site-specific recombinase XerD